MYDSMTETGKLFSPILCGTHFASTERGPPHGAIAGPQVMLEPLFPPS